MPYTLVLTYEERKAFDFIGGRYATGDDVKRELWINSELSPDDIDWYNPEDQRDMTITIPRVVAWTIRDLSEQEEHQWPCFSDELKQKMQILVDSII